VIEIDPYESDIVKFIFREYLAGNSIDYMARPETALSKATKLKLLFHSLDLAQQQTFFRQVFGWNPVYTLGSYRTPDLHPMFLSKAVTVKDLPLIAETTNPLESGSISVSGPDGTRTRDLRRDRAAF
jgi:hypothetical protein